MIIIMHLKVPLLMSDRCSMLKINTSTQLVHQVELTSGKLKI